jgi:hypothetical protein
MIKPVKSYITIMVAIIYLCMFLAVCMYSEPIVKSTILYIAFCVPFLFVHFLLAALVGIWAFYDAPKYGMNGYLVMIIIFIMGAPFGMFFYILRRMRRSAISVLVTGHDTYAQGPNPQDSMAQLKQCPNCKASVNSVAPNCPYCGLQF